MLFSWCHSSQQTLWFKPSILVPDYFLQSLPPGFSDTPLLFHKCIRSALSDVLVPTLLAFVLTKSPSTNSFGNSVTCNFDNATLNRLFPECLKQELGISMIEFNPVAPLLMTKALSRIAELVSNEVFSTLIFNNNCDRLSHSFLPFVAYTIQGTRVYVAHL